MSEPFPVPEEAFEFARRLANAAQTIVDEMGITAPQMVMAVAIYAGTVAALNAKPEKREQVVELAANLLVKIGHSAIHPLLH